MEDKNMKFWALYTINVGDNYEPEIVMHMNADITKELLLSRIPPDARDIYVVDSFPVQYVLKLAPKE